MNQPVKCCSNNWLIRGLSSTIGQKLLMGATGLLLCGFLVAHLAGNLLLVKGSESYNAYAAALHANELLPAAEAALLVLFVLHIILAFSTLRANSAARPIGYARKESKIKDRTMQFSASSTMVLTGLVVLAFLILHLVDMRFGYLNLRGFKLPDHEDAFEHAMRILWDPISAPAYVIGSLFLGVHLSHGFQSAFKSLGLSHPKYSPFLQKLSIAFSIIIAVGFASLPIWAMAIKR